MTRPSQYDLLIVFPATILVWCALACSVAALTRCTWVVVAAEPVCPGAEAAPRGAP